MNRIREHIPSCVGVSRDRREAVFNSTEELLNIDWVKRWSNSLGFLDSLEYINLPKLDTKLEYYKEVQPHEDQRS